MPGNSTSILTNIGTITVSTQCIAVPGSKKTIAIIIGVVVGVAVLVCCVLIVVICIVKCIRNKSKPTNQGT